MISSSFGPFLFLKFCCASPLLSSGRQNGDRQRQKETLCQLLKLERGWNNLRPRMNGLHPTIRCLDIGNEYGLHLSLSSNPSSRSLGLSRQIIHKTSTSPSAI